MILLFSAWESCFANKVPADLLEANVALIFQEFTPNRYRVDDAIEARQTLEKLGYNIVAIHNTTSPYDAQIALADLRAKNVKYIIKFNTINGNYYIWYYPFSEDIDQTFKKANDEFIEEGAMTLEKAIEKGEAETKKAREQNLLTNNLEYNHSLADTIMWSEKDGLEIAKANEVRNILSFANNTLTTYPKEMKGAKIAFVKFTGMDVPFESGLSNSLITGKLKGSGLNYEVFEKYEDYAKRKQEFKYRIVYFNQLSASDLGLRAETTYDMSNGSYKTKLANDEHVSQLFISLLRDEKTGQLYKFSDFDWLGKATKQMIEKLNKL